MKVKPLILLVFLLFSLSNCNNHLIRKKIVITDFSKKRIDTLEPNNLASHVGYYIKIKGHSNDSIKINLSGYNDIKLSGKIDTLMNGDYYGGEKMIFTFSPYKATKGNLEVEYGI